MTLFIRRAVVVTCVFMSFVENVSATGDIESPWDYLVMSDWHGAEFYAHSPGSQSDLYKKQLVTLTGIHDKFGGDLVILPGDTNDGKWFRTEWINKFFPGLPPKEAVWKGGINCYSTIKSLFAESGYETFFLAIGDHELGDNYWGPKSDKTDSLPEYRQSFAKALYMHPESGEYLFKNDFIGNAPPTPYDTEFEYTSFARLHKNVLFVTVDSFYQITRERDFLDRKNGLGGEGTVTGDVAGSHLEWFEFVLSEAQKDDGIKHIIVQSHLPVLQPVRKVQSSSMFLDRAEDSEFWKIMVKYGVDAYFAGEVHTETASKDATSDLVQVVSRALSMESFLKVTVTDNSLAIVSMKERGKKIRTVKKFKPFGTLVIDKSAEKTKISSTGNLELLDISKPLIHFTFEEISPIYERRIDGLTGKKRIRPWNVIMKGVDLFEAMHNQGAFKQQYDAQIGGLKLADKGLLGKAGIFNGSETRMGILSYGPHIGGNVISYSIWFKTSAEGERIMLHFGPAWGTSPKKDLLFTLIMNNGTPNLYSREDSVLKPSTDTGLNDGLWHQVAVSMPHQSCQLSEVKMFIDGLLTQTASKNGSSELFFVNYGQVSVGGFGYSATSNSNFPKWKNFQGEIDEVKVWGRPIWRNDLRESPMKEFVATEGMKCITGSGDFNTQMFTRRNVRQCVKKCNRTVPCMGYQTKKKRNGKIKCTLFMNNKPSINERIYIKGASCARLA